MSGASWKTPARLAWLLATAFSCVTLAEDDGKQLEFRRYLVPEAELRDMIDGLLPMRRQDFPATNRTLLPANRQIEARIEAQIRSARYEVRFDEGQLLDGTARLLLTGPGGTSSLVSLAPCNLAIHRVARAGDPLLSIQVGNDANGDLIAVVDRDDALQFDWSLRGIKTSGGDWQYAIALPQSPVSQLVIDLPDQLTPNVPGGLARPLETNAVDAEIDTEFVPGRRRWLVELGHLHQFELTLRPEGPADEPRASVQQSVVYQLTAAGIEVTAQLTLQVNRPLSQLRLSVGPSLQIASARLGDQQLAIQPSPRASNVQIDFPNPLEIGQRDIYLTALAPIVVGRLWELPTIEVADIVWQQQTISLEIPRILELEQLFVDGLLETGVGPLPSPQFGESRSFQAFRPKSSLQVSLAYRQPDVEVTTGTSIRIGEGGITARQVSEFVAVEGEQFVLDISSPGGWLIDSVETSPPDAFESLKTTGQPGERRLQLRRPVAPGQPVRVMVQAHRGTPEPSRLIGRDFRPVEFLNVASDTRYVALYAESPYQLVLQNDAALRRFSMEELSPELFDLLELSPGAIVYVDESAANQIVVRLRQQQPRFTARITVDATVDGDYLRQQYLIRCELEAGQLERLLVHFTRSEEASVAWSVVDDGDGLVSARKVAGEETTGDTWEITLRRPSAEPFEIQAVQRIRFDTHAHIALASLPEAASQTATFSLAAADGSVLAAEGSTLKSIPPPPQAEKLWPTPRIFYRYDPARRSDLLVSRSRGANHPSAAWIWHCRLTSQIDRSGQTTHTATLRVENLGASQLLVRLPDSVEVDRAAVNAVEFPLSTADQLRQPVAVPLPRDQRFSSVQLSFRTKSPQLGIATSLQPVWPEFEVPCLHRNWSLWLAPGYTVTGGSQAVSRSATSDDWDRRLFGLTLFRSEGRPFDLFNPPDWWQLYHDLRSAWNVRAEARRFLDELRRAAGADRVLDWATLTKRYATNLDSRTPLLIDRTALALIGVTPRSPVRIEGRTESTSETAEWLARSNLAIIVHPDAVLLTSVATLSDYPHTRLGSDHNHVAVAPLARLLSSTNVRLDNGDLVSPASWQTDTIEQQRMWAVSDPPFQIGVGWTNYQFEDSTQQELNVDVIGGATLGNSSWALLLVSAGLVMCMARRHRRWLPLAVLLTAALTLLLPAFLVTPCRGMFIGTLLGSGLSLIAQRKRVLVMPEDSAMTLSTSDSVISSWSGRAGGLALLLVTVGGTILAAQEPDPRPNDPPPNDPLPVYFPIGDDLEPVGKYVYVPPEIYDRIYQRGATRLPGSAPWLIHSAAYEVRFTNQVFGERGTPELMAQWELSTFQARTAVRLRLDQQQHRFPLFELNGQRVTPLWSDEYAEIEIPSSGRAQLTLKSRPGLNFGPSLQEIRLTIPRVARSTLDVATNDSEEVKLPGCRGMIEKQYAAMEPIGWFAQVGPIDEMRIQWMGSSKLIEDAQLSAGQLNWLQIKTDSASMAVRFQCSVLNGKLNRVRLLTDSQLELQEIVDKEGVIASTSDTIQLGNQRAIDVLLSRDFEPPEQFVFTARFLLRGRSGLGPIPLPYVRLAEDLTTRHWLAVSAPQHLEATVKSDIYLQPIGVTDFATAWGDVLSLPDFAYRVPPMRAALDVQVRPLPATTKIRQDLWLAIGRGEAEFAFHVDGEIDQGSRLSQRILVPQAAKIHSIQVSQNDENHLLRWTRADNSEVVAFFDTPLSGSYQIIVEGSLPILSEPEAGIPEFYLPDAQASASRVHLFRRPEVLVRVISAVDQSSLPDESQLPRDRFGRHVASISLHTEEDNSAGQVDHTVDSSLNHGPTLIEIQPNRLRVETRLICEIWYDDDTWNASIDLRADVQLGALDKIRIPISDEWGEVHIDSGHDFHIERVAGSTQRILVLRPQRAIEQSLHARIETKLQTTSDLQFRVPEVTLLDLPVTRKLLVLPKQLAWDVSGMQELERGLPRDYERAFLAPDASAVYRVTSDSPQAVVQDIQQNTGEPQVHLADYFYALQDDGVCQGVATFDLQPGKMKYCQLALPDGFQLVQAFVSGLPASLQPLSETCWEIRLAPDQLPQRIEVLFFGAVSNAAFTSPLALPAPWLRELDVRQTFWSVQGPSAVRLRPLLSHSVVRTSKQEEMRLQVIREMMQSTADVTAQSAPGEIENWKARLVERSRRSEERLRGTPSRESTEADPGPDGSPSPEQSVDIVTTDLAAAWLSYPDRGPLLHCAVRGNAPTFIVYRDHSWLRRLTSGSLFGFAASLLVIFVVLIGRSDHVQEWFVRFPHAGGAALGLLAWSLLTPSLAGLLVAGIMLLGSWRPPFQEN
jgi:hypothetical protein